MFNILVGINFSQNFDSHIDLRPYVNSISAARGVGECPTPWFFLYVFIILCVIVLKLLVANFASIWVKKTRIIKFWPSSKPPYRTLV